MANEEILSSDIPFMKTNKTINAKNKKAPSNPLQDQTGITAETESQWASTGSGRGCPLSRYGEYPEIWLDHFSFNRQPGERPLPTGLVAREYRSGRFLRFGKEIVSIGPPYPLGRNALFVTYNAPDALGCHLALGWGMPERVLDLHAEFRCQKSGLIDPGDYGIEETLKHLGAGGEGTADNPLDALRTLFDSMASGIDLPRALLRGRYSAAVARMEATGVPIDVESLELLREGWEGIRDMLIGELVRGFGVYQGGKFNARLWRAWLNRNHIHWPRIGPGMLDLRLDVFKEMADCYPVIRPIKELRATLALVKPDSLPVGSDGRNRCPLRPFAAKTGRNAPSSNQFVFSLATWARGLVRPREGHALAYVDYEQQEFGIAAALSQDQAMLGAYRSGDPYLAFARQAGAVPENATKDSHRDVRERFKHCALGVQYGMGARGLGIRLDMCPEEAQQLLNLHKRAYSTYWAWSKAVEKQSFASGVLHSVLGWKLNVKGDANPRSVRNFPLQANGAEMLRLACCALTEAGIAVCAPVHDALLIEAPLDGIEEAVSNCQEAMEKASLAVLKDFTLRTEAKVVKSPERYMDDRGRGTWDKLLKFAEGEKKSIDKSGVLLIGN
jgi:hypothetical protein